MKLRSHSGMNDRISQESTRSLAPYAYRAIGVRRMPWVFWWRLKLAGVL
jgi:hypothetical protein